MYKKKIYIFIYLSITLSILSSAAPIDKYYVPKQQQSANYTAQTRGSDVSADFRKKVSQLSDIQKKELKNSLKKERDKATTADVKKYYQDLINVLN